MSFVVASGRVSEARVQGQLQGQAKARGDASGSVASPLLHSESALDQLRRFACRPFAQLQPKRTKSVYLTKYRKDMLPEQNPNQVVHPDGFHSSIEEQTK